MTQRKIQKDQINLEVGNQPGQLIELEGPATGSPAIGVVGLLPELDGSQLRGLSPAGALFNVVEDLTPQLGGNLDLNGLDLTQGTTTIDVTNATLSVQTAASLVAAELQAASATGTANTYLDSGHASSAHGVYLRTFAGSNRGTLLWDPSTSELELQSYPSGSDILLTPGSSGNVILDSFTWPKIDGAPGQVLTTDGAGSLTFGEAGVEFPLRAPTGYVGSPVANEPPYNFDDERNTGWHRPDVQTVTLDVAGDESVRVVKTGGSPGPALGSPDIYANTGIVLHVLNDNVGNSVVRVQQDSGDSSELILDTTGGEWSITNEATNDNLEFKWNGVPVFTVANTTGSPVPSPLFEVVGDSAPQLGGDLDLNGNSLLHVVDIFRASNTATDTVNLTFTAQDSGSADHVYGQILTEIDLPTDTAEDGSMHFDVSVGGSLLRALTLNGNYSVLPRVEVPNSYFRISGNLEPMLDLHNPVAGGSNPTIWFRKTDAGAVERFGGKIACNFTDTTSDSVDTDIVIQSVKDNTSAAKINELRLDSDGILHLERDKGGSGANATAIRLYEASTNPGANYVGIKPPDTVPSDITWTLPTSGNTGELMSLNGTFMDFVELRSTKRTSRITGGTTIGVGAANDFYVCDVTAGNITLQLHATSIERFRPFMVKVVDATATGNTVTVTGGLGSPYEPIDGSASPKVLTGDNTKEQFLNETANSAWWTV